MLMHVGTTKGGKVVITVRMCTSIRALVMTTGMIKRPGSTRRTTNPVGNLTKLDITLQSIIIKKLSVTFKVKGLTKRFIKVTSCDFDASKQQHILHSVLKTLSFEASVSLVLLLLSQESIWACMWTIK